MKDFIQRSKLLLKQLTGLTNGAWLLIGVPFLIDVAAHIKQRKEEKEAATRGKKIAYDMEKKPYDADIKALETIDKQLREELLQNYEGSSALYPESGDGQVSFKREWKATIVTPLEVPPEFWSPDMAKIMKVVEDGRRKIPGVVIEHTRSPIVYTKRQADSNDES